MLEDVTKFLWKVFIIRIYYLILGFALIPCLLYGIKIAGGKEHLCSGVILGCIFWWILLYSIIYSWKFIKWFISKGFVLIITFIFNFIYKTFKFIFDFINKQYKAYKRRQTIKKYIIQSILLLFCLNGYSQDLEPQQAPIDRPLKPMEEPFVLKENNKDDFLLVSFEYNNTKIIGILYEKINFVVIGSNQKKRGIYYKIGHFIIYLSKFQYKIDYFEDVLVKNFKIASKKEQENFKKLSLKYGTIIRFNKE